MKAVDTNILVRFLVGDDDAQARKAYDIFKKAESDKYELFVPLLVMLELIWVLESAYAISRKEILDSIGELLLMPIFKFEQQTALQQFALATQGNKYDLADLLIACSAKNQGCVSVITFDKKASQSSFFELA